VLLFSQYFPPEVGATQTRMQSFAEHLAARGHDVTVVAEFPNHPHGVMPKRYRGRLLEDDRTNDYRVLRVWVKTAPEKTQRTRLELYLSYMALATAVAPLAGRPDVVLATSPPLFTGVAGAVVARAMRAPFVLDVRDLWPAAAISLEQMSPGLTLRASHALERWLYREAVTAVAVTRPFCDHIDALRERDPRTVLIPNGTLELFFSDGERGARTELGGQDGRFLVTFAGTHGIAQALPAVVEAAELAPDIDFALVGEGPMKDSLERLVEQRGLRNVHFRSQRPLDQMPPLLTASDALLVPLSGHPTFADFVPSKMIDFMAAGRPVLLSAAGEAARILERSGAGVVVPPEDPAALAAAARQLRDDPEGSSAMGRRGREFAMTRLRSAQAERLERVLLDVVRR
jgi:glycosyltransferase involved in cell wall biosynthesis